MISNHLSLVEALRPKSNELADQIAEFVAAGGKIDVVEPPPPPKPVVYVPREPPAPKPFVRRRVEAVPLPVEPSDLVDMRLEARRKKAEQVMAMAPTHTQTEVMHALGICRRTLLSMSKEFGFQFKRTNHGGYNGPERQKQLLERDEKYAERIKAFKELGITRSQCCGKLAISNKTLERLLAKFGIDYPKARRGSTSCAA